MAAPPAPLPPAVTAQATPQGAQSAFQADNIGQPQPGMEMVQQALGAIRKIEEGMDGLLPIILNMQPTMQEKIAPVREVIVRAARTLLEFRQTLMQTAQRSGMAQGSPVMPVPGPGQQGLGSPAAGPPEMMQGEGGIGG